MSDKKKIEVVPGTGKDLDISPVYNHIELEKPRKKKNEDEIIVPEEQKKDN